MAKIAGIDWQLCGQLKVDRRTGEQATAVIRIERTQTSDSPGENCPAGKMDAAVYLGERWDYLFHAGGLRVRVRATAAPVQKPYWLHFPKEALWIF